MEFENKAPKWDAAGAKPSTDLQKNGFVAGYKPPAAYFNYLFNTYTKCVNELQALLKEHEENNSNIHNVTAKQVGAYRTYTTLTEIGLSVGTETIPAICNAMSDKSMLIIEVGGGNNGSMYPKTDSEGKAYGTLVVTRRTSTRIVFEFFWHGDLVQYWYGAANTTDTWSGWKKAFTTDGGKLQADGLGGQLQIHRNGTSGTACIAFENDNGVLGYIGMSDAGVPVFVDPATGNIHTLYNRHNKPTPADIGAPTIAEHNELKDDFTELDGKVLRSRETINNITEEQLKALGTGSYRILSADTSVMPCRWGDLVVFDTPVEYRGYLFFGTDGNLYHRTLNYNNGSWYSGWKQIFTTEGGTVSSVNTVPFILESKSEDNRTLQGFMKNGTYYGHIGFEGVDNPVVRTTGGSYKKIYGDHNKPSGSYTGNGSASDRKFETGGIGDVVVIWSSYVSCILTPSGGIAFDERLTNPVYAIPYAKARAGAGTFRLLTTDAALNANGATYYWKLL